MITGEDIERAERMLSIIYEENSVPRQMQQSEVDLDSFNNFLQSRVGLAHDRQPVQWRKVDPRVHHAYNTLLMHFFLVGLTIGRTQEAE